MLHFQLSYVFWKQPTTSNTKVCDCPTLSDPWDDSANKHTFHPWPLSRTQWQHLGYSYVSEAKKNRVYTSCSLGLHEPRDIYEGKDAEVGLFQRC